MSKCVSSGKPTMILSFTFNPSRTASLVVRKRLAIFTRFLVFFSIRSEPLSGASARLRQPAR